MCKVLIYVSFRGVMRCSPNHGDIRYIPIKCWASNGADLISGLLMMVKQLMTRLVSVRENDIINYMFRVAR